MAQKMAWKMVLEKDCTILLPFPDSKSKSHKRESEWDLWKEE
jgi:hypothetical protein